MCYTLTERWRQSASAQADPAATRPLNNDVDNDDLVLPPTVVVVVASALASLAALLVITVRRRRQSTALPRPACCRTTHVETGGECAAGVIVAGGLESAGLLAGSSKVKVRLPPRVDQPLVPTAREAGSIDGLRRMSAGFLAPGHLPAPWHHAAPRACALPPPPPPNSAAFDDAFSEYASTVAAISFDEQR